MKIGFESQLNREVVTQMINENEETKLLKQIVKNLFALHWLGKKIKEHKPQFVGDYGECEQEFLFFKNNKPSAKVKICMIYDTNIADSDISPSIEINIFDEDNELIIHVDPILNKEEFRFLYKTLWDKEDKEIGTRVEKRVENKAADKKQRMRKFLTNLQN